MGVSFHCEQIRAVMLTRLAGEQGWGFCGKSLTWGARGLLSVSVQFQERGYTSSCAPSLFRDDASKGDSAGPWLLPPPATHTHTSPSHHLSWGFPGREASSHPYQGAPAGGPGPRSWRLSPLRPLPNFSWLPGEQGARRGAQRG